MSDSSDEEIENYQADVVLSDDEQEVRPSDEDDDDDSEDFDQDARFDRFKIELKKDEMASDIEDDDEPNYLPNSQAWGREKKQFYDTDFVDKDFRSLCSLTCNHCFHSPCSLL